jgi:peroxiredoxin
MELTAYRDRYADATAKDAHILAVSADDRETLRRYREHLGAPYPFIADTDGSLAGAYGVRGAITGGVKRFTFVIGQDRRIVYVTSGLAALRAGPALDACPLAARGG